MDGNTFDIPPPGHFIREELEAREWSQRDLAYILGVLDPEVNMIISGKRGISPEMAKSLGKAFGVPAELFSNLQRSYDLSRAREPDPDVGRKARLQSVFPMREMIKRGWLTDTSGPLLEAEVARFFEAETVEEMPHFAHAAKKGKYNEDITPAQLAWLFRVRQIAKEMPVPTYSEKKLRASLVELKKLMIDPSDARHVPRILSECGVRYVIVEALPNSKIDGACFWLDKSPVIGMSMLRDRIDNFWFVLRHEIEHVLQKHGQENGIVDTELDGKSADTDGDMPEEERVANYAASDYCVPIAEMDSFYERKQPFFSERDLLGFARRMQVHPGIVAGQLRKRLDRWDLFTRLLVKVRQFATSGAMVDGWGEIAPVYG